MNLISIYRMVLYKFPNEIATIISNNLLCIYISSKYTRVNNNFRYVRCIFDCDFPIGYSDFL